MTPILLPNVTDFYQYSAAETAEAPANIVLFICGNPGLISYYDLFLTTMTEELPGTLVLGISHVNQGFIRSSIVPTKQPATLRDQVKHKIELLDELNAKYKLDEGKVKLSIVAHSIGSWISLGIMEQRPTLVTSLNFLFPTLSHIALSPNGLRLAPLFSPRLINPLHYTTSFLSYLPTKALNLIVAVSTQQDSASAMVTTQLITSPTVVAAVISMASEEMTDVCQLNESILWKYGDRMRFYWAAHDGWVAESSITEIERTLDEGAAKRPEAASGFRKEKRVRCDDGMLHAFCINDLHAITLARKCTEWIKEDLTIV